MRKVGLLLAIALFLTVASLAVGDSLATATTPAVSRAFYFSGVSPSGTLSPTPPTNLSPNRENFTGRPINFTLGPPFLSSFTLSGPPVFNIWLSKNFSSPVSVSVRTFLYVKDFYGNTAPYPVSTNCSNLSPCTITLQPFPQTLPFGDQVSIGVNATLSPTRGVTLSWGSPSTPSSVNLQMSGYSTIGKVDVLDWSQSAATSFNINASKGQNIVFIQTPATAALGKADIRNVNLTIVDPSFEPVPSAKNLTMLQLPASTTQPYTYTAEWTYPSNITEGNYQVWIDIVDIQGKIAFSLRGPVGFAMFRPGIHPLDLVPYVAGAGAGVFLGFVYYRRRKKKEYLAPFDHFFTLTSGGVPPGTMVTVEGNTGSGKSLLSEQLMYDDLRAGRPCVFVSTADFPSKIRIGMRSLGLETESYENKEALRFVDCYSAEAGQPSQEKLYVSSLGDLTSLGVKITSALSAPAEGPSVFFDSLTPLAPKSKPESIVSFAQTVGAKVRGMGGKAYFTVGSSVDESILRQLEEASDCIIQMEAFEEKGVRRRRMRITKFRNRRFHEGWVTFTIEDGKGIIFYSKKPRQP